MFKIETDSVEDFIRLIQFIISSSNSEENEIRIEIDKLNQSTERLKMAITANSKGDENA